MPLKEASCSFIIRRCPNGWFSVHLVNRVRLLQRHIRLPLPYVKPEKPAPPCLIRRRRSWSSTGPPSRGEYRPTRDYRRIRLLVWLCSGLLVIGLKSLRSVSCPSVASRKRRCHRAPCSTTRTAKTTTNIRLLIIPLWTQDREDMLPVSLTMIWWTHELRRSWSVGTGSPCSSWWRSGLSWTAHVWDRKGEVLLRWRWRGGIIPAVIVRINREAIRSWDFAGNRWAGVPSESWTLWNASSGRGRGMNRANVGYIWAWVTCCWRCWFCKVTLLAEKIVICAMVSNSDSQ